MKYLPKKQLQYLVHLRHKLQCNECNEFFRKCLVDLSKVFEPYNNIDPQIGLVIIWPAITLLPSVLDEYLVCDGTGYDPSDNEYMDLFNQIDYNYGREEMPGDTPDFFRVPDLSDKTIVMNTNAPPSNKYYGTDSTFNEGISINEENMPAHSHSISGSIADHTHEFDQVNETNFGEGILAYATYWAFGGVNNIPVKGGNYKQHIISTRFSRLCTIKYYRTFKFSFKWKYRCFWRRSYSSNYKSLYYFKLFNKV